MNNYSKHTSSTSTSISAGLLATLTLATLANVAGDNRSMNYVETRLPPATAYSTAGNSTASQFANYAASSSVQSVGSFEDQVANVFKILASEQTDIDPDIKRVIFENMWDLYVE